MLYLSSGSGAPNSNCNKIFQRTAKFTNRKGSDSLSATLPCELRPLFLRVGYAVQGLLLLMHFAPRGVFGGSDSFKVTWHQCLERSYLCLLTTKTDLLHHYTQPGSERLVTIPTHEPVIVAQRRAGKETHDINAAGISQREQIASAEASVAQRGRHEGRFPEVRSLQTLMPNPRRSPART